MVTNSGGSGGHHGDRGDGGNVQTTNQDLDSPTGKEPQSIATTEHSTFIISNHTSALVSR
jgi:hypothetical protein